MPILDFIVEAPTSWSAPPPTSARFSSGSSFAREDFDPDTPNVQTLLMANEEHDLLSNIRHPKYLSELLAS